jgi:large subunit ribosomal protein L32e
MKFLRRDCARYSKFGNGRGKKAKWRAPKGRDNKMREKRKGYQAVVSIGYGTEKTKRGLLNNKEPVTIMNLKDLVKIKDGKVGFIGKVGEKKKIEIVKKAKEMNIELKNINIKSFLKKINKKEKKE